MVLLEVSLMNFILRVFRGDQMPGRNRATRGIIDELHSWEIQGDQTKGESGVTRSIIDELHTSYIQGDQMESESGVT